MLFFLECLFIFCFSYYMFSADTAVLVGHDPKTIFSGSNI